MPKQTHRAYTPALKQLMAEKSRILSKAQALADMELDETAQPLWWAAATREERIAPLLESLGRDAEAALHRISAASCCEKSGEPSRAVNLYRAALAGPLPEDVCKDVQKKLSTCLTMLSQTIALTAGGSV